MKKTYLIIGGVSAVLLLLAIWVYLLIYGTPKPVEQFFTDFSFSGTADNTIPIAEIPIETAPQVDTTTAQLRQLTTRPVIGMGEYIDTTIEPKIAFIRYAEAGTGHVYSINITTGEETRLSNTTIPGASRAMFSPSGKYVAITAGYTNQPTVTIVTIGNTLETNTSNTLTQKIVDFSFSDSNELLYTEYSSSGQTGRVLNLETSAYRTIFTIPFQSATVIWSQNISTPHYTYPKTSSKLPGYLYQLSDNNLKRLPVTGAGLSALANNEYLVSTRLVNNTPLSRSLNPKTGTGVALPIIADPDKCALSAINTEKMYCGNDQVEYGFEFPDDWHKGLRAFNDRLYEIDLKRGSATQLISPEATLGRTIDVIHMTISATGEMLYFVNKNDNTLWMYEI